MDRIHQMQVLVAVAEERGFSSAARRLGLSGPAITRAVASLEEDLNVQLFKRTTRQVRITEAGARYLEDVKRILSDITEAEETISGTTAAPRGHLVVTAPTMFGRLHVMPGIATFLKKFPEMTVDALFLDRIVDMLEEGVDVGVRIGRLPDSSIRARKVGEVRTVLVASPDYLKARGTPRSPQDLAKHALIAARTGNFSPAWGFSAENREISLKVKPKLTATSHDAVIEAAANGLGITRALSYQVAPAVAEGRLMIVLGEWEQAPIPVHIIHREDRSAPVKVRAFIDCLCGHLEADLV
ncbi:LysR family transcriptional regulator [Marinobacter alexandrii]|uniref:LysR family transcriptional regulator n=1 Tax=Marinobacter alexandrii TaxID=2570351 RepID=UPI001109A651|nr:LysR family transcriptional regulator [Marinobacter alexandrii]